MGLLSLEGFARLPAPVENIASRRPHVAVLVKPLQHEVHYAYRNNNLQVVAAPYAAAASNS